MKKLFVLALAFLVAAPPFLMAAPMATLFGQVNTTSGQAVSGLEVRVVEFSTGAVTVVTTDENGAYRLNVAPGRYVVDAGSVADIVEVKSGEATRVNLAGVAVTKGGATGAAAKAAGLFGLSKAATLVLGVLVVGGVGTGIYLATNDDNASPSR